MTFNQAVIGILFGLGLASGQVLFKLAAIQTDIEGKTLPLIRVLFTWQMIAACTLYALTVVVYVYLLQQMPLSRAYMFSFLGSALVPILAIFLFGETITPRYLIGVTLLLAGIYITTTS